MRIILFLFLPLYLFALEAKVQIQINKNQEFFVSKKTTLMLKVMSTGFQMNNLEVDYGDNKDFVIIAPSSASYNQTEGDYSVVVYEYEIYALKKGKVALLPWKVNFDVSLGYGMPKEHFTKSTKNKVLTIASVKGYDFLLATSKLEVKTSYSSKEDSFIVGEALQRNIKITAVDVPDLLIPAITATHLKGLQVYEDEVRLSQKKFDSKVLATRIQKETYVFNSEGNYTLPTKILHWYNTKSKKVEKVEIQGKIFSVIAPPLPTKKIDKKSFSLNLFYLLYGISFFLFILILFKWYKNKKPKVKKRAKSLLVKSINPGK